MENPCLGEGATQAFVRGRRVHPTHLARWFAQPGYWVCTSCGCSAGRGMRGLGFACSGSASVEGRRALSRVSKGLLPWQAVLGRCRRLVPKVPKLANKPRAAPAAGLKLLLGQGRRVKRKPEAGLKRRRRSSGAKWLLRGAALLGPSGPVLPGPVERPVGPGEVVVETPRGPAGLEPLCCSVLPHHLSSSESPGGGPDSHSRSPCVDGVGGRFFRVGTSSGVGRGFASPLGLGAAACRLVCGILALRPCLRPSASRLCRYLTHSLCVRCCSGVALAPACTRWYHHSHHHHHYSRGRPRLYSNNSGHPHAALVGNR